MDVLLCEVSLTTVFQRVKAVSEAEELQRLMQQEVGEITALDFLVNEILFVEGENSGIDGADERDAETARDSLGGEGKSGCHSTSEGA